MMALIKKLYAKFQYEVRFLITGVINTAVGYGSYALFIYLGMSLHLAYILSTVVGVANSYVWNKLFTFKSRKKSFAELVRFVSVYLLSFVIGLFLLPFLVNNLGMNKYVAGICNIFVTTIISYFGHRFFSFKNPARQP